MERIKSGQWIGVSQVGSAGKAMSILNIERRSIDRAQVIGIERDFGLTGVSEATVIEQGGKIVGRISNTRLLFRGEWMTFDQFYARQGIKEQPPQWTDYECVYNGERSSGTTINNLGIRGTFAIDLASGDNPLAADHQFSWKEFRDFAMSDQRKGFVYLGETCNKWSLRTTLHRCHRYDLLRFFEEDFKRLRHKLNAQSRHVYSLSEEDVYALLSLSQHHGFPTPLLDWTKSPFVAAFFAFNASDNDAQTLATEADPFVRVYAFDYGEWEKMQQWRSLLDPFPRLQFMELPAHNNPRYLPQQSVASFATIAGIERFVRVEEARCNRRFLSVIDLPFAERSAVQRELRLCGITLASLFPGVDGLCRDLREEYFTPDE